MVSTRNTSSDGPNVKPLPRIRSPHRVPQAAVGPRSPRRKRTGSASPAPTFAGRRTLRNAGSAVPVMSALNPTQIKKLSGKRLKKNSRSKRAGSAVSESAVSSNGQAETEDNGGQEAARQTLPRVREGEEANFQQTPYRRLLYSHSPVSQISDTTSDPSYNESNLGVETSGTQLEMEDMDLELIFETIPDLEANAQKLLNLLVSSSPLDNLLRDLRALDSSTSRRLAVYRGQFNASKSAFGSSEYISAHIVEKKLGLNMFAPILFKANIAVLADFIFTAKYQSDATYQELKKIERTFPNQFGDQVSRHNLQLALDLRTQTLILGMLLTQGGFNPEVFLRHFFMEKKDDDGSQRADNYTVKSWPDVDVSGWEVAVLDRMEQIRSTFKTARDEAGETPRHDNEEIVDFDKLKRRFPWAEFRKNMVAYIQGRLRELSSGVNIQNLVADAKNASNGQLPEFPQTKDDGKPAERESDVTLVEAHAQRASMRVVPVIISDGESSVDSSPSRAEPEREESYATAPQAAAPTEDRLSFSQIAYLKNLKSKFKAQHDSEPADATQSAEAIGTNLEQMAELKRRRDIAKNPEEKEPRQSLPSPQAHVSPPAENNDPMLDEDIEEIQPEMPPQSSAILEFELYNNLQMQKNKENQPSPPAAAAAARPRKRFNAPQPNAVRLEFNETQELQQTPSQEPNRGRKRARSPEEDSDNDVFVMDDRDEDVHRVKRSRRDLPQRQEIVGQAPKVAARHRSRSSSADLGPQSPKQIRRQIVLRNELDPIVRSRRNRVASADPDVDDDEDDEDSLPDSTEIRRVKRLAKMNYMDYAPLKPQSRKSWDLASENRLVKLIEQVGCRWAVIRDKQDPLLEGRSDVQLKDKARNIKLEYLKAKIVLPHNFKNVTISKKHIEMLVAMGIDPEYDGCYE